MEDIVLTVKVSTPVFSNICRGGGYWDSYSYDSACYLLFFNLLTCRCSMDFPVPHFQSDRCNLSC